MGNQVIAARRSVYRWLYERRVDSPGVFFDTREMAAAAGEPGLSAALAFGLETGHLETKRGHFALTAAGMLFAETAGYVEGDE